MPWETPNGSGVGLLTLAAGLRSVVPAGVGSLRSDTYSLVAGPVTCAGVPPILRIRHRRVSDPQDPKYYMAWCCVKDSFGLTVQNI